MALNAIPGFSLPSGEPSVQVRARPRRDPIGAGCVHPIIGSASTAWSWIPQEPQPPHADGGSRDHAEVRRVVEEELTAHQRRIFVAIVIDQIPRDALAAELSLQKNAIYKVVFDARRKIRCALVAKGYLEEPGWSGDE